jgi:hypothetical protein
MRRRVSVFVADASEMKRFVRQKQCNHGETTRNCRGQRELHVKPGVRTYQKTNAKDYSTQSVDSITHLITCRIRAAPQHIGPSDCPPRLVLNPAHRSGTRVHHRQKLGDPLCSTAGRP